MASVTLCGLESKPKLNGRAVTLVAYHCAKERWEVELEGDLPVDDLFKVVWDDSWHKPNEDTDKLDDKDKGKPTFKETIEQHLQKKRVTTPLKDLLVLDCNLMKMSLNDEEGNLLTDLTGPHLEHAWRKSFPLLFQKAPRGGKTLAVKPGCLRMREEDAVERLRFQRVEMVVNAAHKKPALDGESAELRPFKASSQRWQACPDVASLWDVKVDGSPCPVLLLSTELRDYSSGAQLQDPVRVAPRPCAEGQKALYATGSFKRGQVILEDDPVMFAGGGEGNELARVFQQFQHLTEDESVAFLALSRGPEYLWRLLDRVDYIGNMMQTTHEDFQNLDDFVTHSPKEKLLAWDVLRIFDSNCSRHAYKEGRLLYLKLSLINHSCRPNAVLADPKPEESKYGGDTIQACKKVLIAVRDISEGEEITVSHLSGDRLSLLEPLERRQERLSHGGFTCTCQRCLDDQTTDPLRTFRCVRAASCAGTHSAGRDGFSQCSVCGAVVGEADASRLLSGEAAQVKVHAALLTSLSSENLVPAPDLLTKSIDAAAECGLGPAHWLLCRQRELLFSFFQRHHKWDLASSVASDQLAPVLDLHLKTLGYHDHQLLESLADNLARTGQLAEAFSRYSMTLDAMKWMSPEQPAGKSDGCKSDGCERVRQKLRQTLLGKLDNDDDRAAPVQDIAHVSPAWAL